MRSFHAILVAWILPVASAATTAANPGKPVSSELFQRFVRYTTFTVASVPQPCPQPPYGSKVVAYINETSTDTQATIFRDDVAKEIVLSIPGTATFHDDLTDITAILGPYISSGVSCSLCAVHVGFLGAWNSISAQAQSLINQTLASNPSYKVIVTGHSLGAAIAQLAYASLTTLKYPVAAAYTMGQPRIGNAVYANYIDGLSKASDTNAGNFYRITHASDPIPGLPPQITLYRHSRTEYWESGQAVQNASTTYLCTGQENPNCSDGHQNLSDPDSHVLYSNINFGSANTLCGV